MRPGAAPAPVDTGRAPSAPRPRGRPRSWCRGSLYAGGQVHAAGAKLDRIRLTLANGTQVEDDAVGAVALFVADQAAEPVTVELFDSTGRLVASHGA